MRMETTIKAAEIILNSSSKGNKDDSQTKKKEGAAPSGDSIKQNCDVSLESAYLKMASANEVSSELTIPNSLAKRSYNEDQIPVHVLLEKANMTKDTEDPKIIRKQRQTKAHAKSPGHSCYHDNTKLKQVVKSRRPFICPNCYIFFCDFDRFQRHIKRHRVSRWHSGSNLVMERSPCETDQYSSSHVGGHVHEYSLALRTDVINEYSLPMAGDDTNFSFFEPFSSAELALGKSVTSNDGTCNDKELGFGKYPCTTCGKLYASKSGLIKHVRTHFNIRPFRCELCGKEFTQKGHLDGHMNTHTGLKPFQCTQCDKKFSRKSDLQRHVLIHTGDRPFKCNSCTMSFLSKDALNKHIDRIHTMIKPYQCTYCSKCYSRTDDFARHVRTVHEDPVKKPYSCGYCGKSFQSKDHLSKHEMIHTGEKPYACGVCGKAFARKYDVKRHANKVHADYVK